ncbi:MAG TPA: Ig-like domain-containing protein [Actinomycetota bacterium]
MKGATLDTRARALLTGVAVAVAALLMPGIAEAAPTAPIDVVVVDGGDGYINAAEAAGLTVTGTATSPDAVEAVARLVNSPTCDFAATEIAPLVEDIPVAGDGTFSITGFTLSAPQGATICARAALRDASAMQGPTTTSSNAPILDTIAPSIDTLTINDGGDGIASDAADNNNGPSVTWAISGTDGNPVAFTANNTGEPVPADCAFNRVSSNTGRAGATCAAGLLDGEVTYTFTAVDVAGNTTTGSDTTILDSGISATLDIPLIGSGNQGSVAIAIDTPDQLDVSGTVTLSDGTTSVSGPVSSTSPTAIDATSLAAGPITVTTALSDLAGNAASPSGSTVKDLTSSLEITSHEDGDFVKTDFTLRGTAEAGSAIVVTRGASVVGSDTADADGTWTALVSGQPTGIFAYTVTATDPASNVAAAVISLHVDGVHPAAPQVDYPENFRVLSPDDDKTIEGIAHDINRHAWAGVLALKIEAYKHTSVNWIDELAAGQFPSGPAPQLSAYSGQISAWASCTESCSDTPPSPPAGSVPVVGRVVLERNAQCPLCDTDAGDADVDWSWDASVLGPGTYTLIITTLDRAGNTSKEAGTVTLTIL